VIPGAIVDPGVAGQEEKKRRKERGNKERPARKSAGRTKLRLREAVTCARSRDWNYAEPGERWKKKKGRGKEGGRK